MSVDHQRKRGNSADSREWLSAEELADWLGIPVETVYQWNTKRIGPPRIRIGKHIRYRRLDIERWINSQYVNDK